MRKKFIIRIFKITILSMFLLESIAFSASIQGTAMLRVPMGVWGNRIDTARKIELLKKYIRRRSKGHDLVEIRLPPPSNLSLWGSSVRPILSSAIQSGKGIVFIMPQGLDNNRVKDLYDLAGIFEHVAHVIDSLLVNVWDAQYPLRELFKNAFYHGNKLDFNLPIFLYIDLEDLFFYILI